MTEPTLRRGQVRTIWHGHWLRFSLGEAHYYGWRWWLDIGPVTVLIGMSGEEGEHGRHA